MSTLKVDTITTISGTGNINVSRPLSGSGASLTSLPAANLTGTLPAISGASLTNLPSSEATYVQFPATQVASADANRLDDYEEGTWTPASPAGITSTDITPSGIYTRIGRVVYVQVQILVNSGTITTTASAYYGSGLPFTPARIHVHSGWVSDGQVQYGEQLIHTNGRYHIGAMTSEPNHIRSAGFYYV